jgi:hypothetical protein
MSKLSRLALIFVVALVAIGARQLTSPAQDPGVDPAAAPLPGASKAAAYQNDQHPDWDAWGRELLYRNP